MGTKCILDRDVIEAAGLCGFEDSTSRISNIADFHHDLLEISYRLTEHEFFYIRHETNLSQLRQHLQLARHK